MTRRAGTALLLLGLAMAGCSFVQGVKSRLPPREPQPGPDDGAYADLREAVTRRARLFDGFVHRADLNGTWISLAVRETGTRRLAAWQGWSAAELEAQLLAGRAEAQKGEEFFLALYTAERRDNDLADRGSIWRVTLDDGALRVAAGSVEHAEKDASTRALFPYIGPYDEIYRVRVPWTGAPLEGRVFSLKLQSALGTLDLDFGPNGRQGDRPHQAP